MSILGWLFTPWPGSEEGIARHQPYGPPREFLPASTCLGQDRMVSGSRSVTTRGFPTRSLAVCVAGTVPGTNPDIECRLVYTVADIRFPYVIAGVRLRLATTRDSPARDSRRNPQRRSAVLVTSLTMVTSYGIHTFSLRGELQARFGLFSRRSRGSFQLSLRLLVHYRTPDIFRLRRSALLYSVGNPGPAYSSSGRPQGFAYGAVTLFRCPFQETSASLVGSLPVPHLVFISDTIQLGLYPFHSPLLRASRLFSFPPATMMFRFTGFPFRSRSPWFGSTRHYCRAVPRSRSGFRNGTGLPYREVAFGDPRIADCMRLPAEYRSWPRPSSVPEPSRPRACVCVSNSSRVGVNPDSQLSARLDDWDASG